MSHDKGERESIYAGSYKIQTEVLTQWLEEIGLDELKELGERFKENMVQLDFMVSLPAIICAIESIRMDHLVLEIKARVKSRALKLEEANQEKRDKYREELKRIWKAEYEPKLGELVSKALDIGEDDFRKLLRYDIVYEPYRSLLYAGIVWTWCSFELLTKELWEAALNTRGKYVRKNILQGIGKSPRIQSDSPILGKYISLDYLAKYDYDLSNSLGTALSYKFDFTSCHGIKEAYSYAFPRSTTISEALDRNILIQLEVRRNVIVHKAGILDAAFCDKTCTDRKEIGSKLKVRSEDIYEFGNAVIDTGLCLMKAVSLIISRRKAEI